MTVSIAGNGISGGVLRQAEEVMLATEMIKFGARLQVLEAEVSLSRDRLIRLYKELMSASPPKGQLPFSIDWFLSWRPNAHASLYMAAYEYLTRVGDRSRVQKMLAAYRLYTEQVRLIGEDLELSFTRAWTLVRFVEARALESQCCKVCNGKYVRYAHDLNFVCGLCAPPSRAAKGTKRKDSRNKFSLLEINISVPSLNHTVGEILPHGQNLGAA